MNIVSFESRFGQNSILSGIFFAVSPQSLSSRLINGDGQSSQKPGLGLSFVRKALKVIPPKQRSQLIFIQTFRVGSLNFEIKKKNGCMIVISRTNLMYVS